MSPSVERTAMGPVARLVHALIRAYQWAFAWKPSPCRYTPSCSTYALEAVEQHGAVRGAWLAARRVGRCHPWGGHGYDPVPSPGTGRRRRGPARTEQQVA